MILSYKSHFALEHGSRTYENTSRCPPGLILVSMEAISAPVESISKQKIERKASLDTKQLVETTTMRMEADKSMKRSY